MAERSPMMEQYFRAKSRHRDAVLFFRLGDFYEMFFEDAVEVSALLNLTLTKRQGEPMCGVPYHAARSYVARLLRLGKKVAICEQLGEPGPGKGLVERDVVEVITPGTAMEEDFLEEGANNYLLALCSGEARLACAYLDLGTAEFRAFSFPAGDPQAVEARLGAELYRLAPREILLQQSLLELPEIARALAARPALIVNRLPDWSFDARLGAEELKERFGLATLKGFGFAEAAPELAAARALLRYVDDTAKSAASHITSLLPYEAEDFALIDEASQKNLELVQNSHDGGRAYSLLEILDFTKSSPGARLLRQWLLQPLRRRESAQARLEAVDFLYRNQRLLATLRESLGRVLDAERLASRVAMDKAHAKDLLALRDSIKASLAARRILAEAGASTLVDAAGGKGPEGEALERIEAAQALIEKGIAEEPSILLSEGELIREGYDAELDRLRAIKEDSRAVLEAYLEEERAGSGIANLRVRYNRIIGYYLEVSKGRLEAVPSHFIRRQSLVNGERFTTSRLASIESEINGATERMVELERRLFLSLREELKKAVPELLALGRATAVLDCLASFAWAATARGYSKPRLSDSGIIRIRDGRHPVVEAHLPTGSFVPNGIELAAFGVSEPAPASLGPGEGLPAPASQEHLPSSVAKDGVPSFALITGPNMAGKSTFLRQTALIVLMAQAGSFVPASEAELGMADRIFCRVGAHDDLARGESTFLVEMHETARILNTATARSLVVMDEVGRGTSTNDGLAIAWAVAERLLEVCGARSLFATHYHELTALEHPRLVNLSMAVLEEEGEVIFLKRIEAGPAAASYGLHVARLAGLPREVLERAALIQAELSAKERILPGRGSVSLLPEAPRPAPAGPAAQAALFDPGELVLAELASLDIDKLSPLEALNRLAQLKARLK